MDGLIVKKCVLRGRPQGGRAVFIVDFDSGDGCSSSSIVNSSSFVEIRTFDIDFDRAARFLTPSRVEMIGKRSILCLQTTTNR
eukprot:scaffold5921_cov228-Skeletonema_marinoi.AAC.1